MPIDEQELASVLKSAYDKLTINGNEKIKLRKFILGCTEITQQYTEEDPQVLKDIMDSDLGVKMTTTRRQAIYDKLLANKTELGL